MKILQSPLRHFSSFFKVAKSALKQKKTLPKSSPHEIELNAQNRQLNETEAKLSAALYEYSELFELSPVGYFILDKNGTIENVNERGTIQLGASRQALIGQPFSAFLKAEQDQDNFHRHRIAAISDRHLERLECEVKKESGTFFSAFIKLKLMLDEKSRFKHLLTMMSDISEIKAHERQMELQVSKLTELNAKKSGFIGMASHEFRTPLTSILSGTALIENYSRLGENDKIEKHLTRIKSSIYRLITILDELLSVEKLESGKLEVNRTDLNLRHLCENIIEEVAAVLKKGQTIQYSHDGNPEITSDAKVLQHIILNLLSNASKYSAEGMEIKVTTQITDHLITIEVADQGIGIPEAEQANIFTSFFRAHNTGNIEGTGLGLCIVKRYVELLNGEISFVSKANEGTTFTVEFPK